MPEESIYGDAAAYEAVTGKDIRTRTRYRPDGSPVDGTPVGSGAVAEPMLAFTMSDEVARVVGAPDEKLYPGLIRTSCGNWQGPARALSSLYEDLLDSGSAKGLGQYSDRHEREACRRVARRLAAALKD